MDKTAQRILRGISTTGLCRCGGMDADNIEMEVNNWEKNRWRRDIDSKTTLVLYRSKRNMGDGVYTAMNMVRSCYFNVEPIP